MARGFEGAGRPNMGSNLQARSAIDAIFQDVHRFVDLIEAVDSEKQVVHLVHLHRGAQYFIQTEWAHIATALEYVGTLTV